MTPPGVIDFLFRRRQPGSIPIFLMIEPASGAVRNFISALAASGAGAAVCRPAENTVYVLDVGWQRPEVVDALHMEKFADLLEAEIGFPARHQLAYLNAGRGLLHLVLDLIGDAHFFEQIRNIEAARP